jgi:catechol 2,3-dioxygenase-like lactoylglutathione lyase family enzyme
MTIQRMHHVGVVVGDLEAAAEFFAELGLQRGGAASVGGDLVDRIIALDGVQAEILFMQTPDGHGRLELTSFRSPAPASGDAKAPANALGLRHLSFEVEDLDAALTSLGARGVEPMGEVVQYESSYRLCYVRGPEGIIVELAEPLA